MTPERWRDLQRLYHAALEHAPQERAAFLEHACGLDEALAGEVESLLKYQTRSKDFIETPAAGAGLSVVAEAIRRLHATHVPGQFAGRMFGSYEVQALIAAGGIGEVYRALDTRLGRTVAIKMLLEHLTDDADSRERFRREAQIVSHLNHPHICALYDVGTQDGVEYLVMEYVDGETLEKPLRTGPLPLPQAIEFLIQIVDALDKAHRRGVVHGDLKPANIMLTKSGIKLLDFGLGARFVPRGGTVSDGSGTQDSHGLTAEVSIIGTVQYMSPEQFQGRLPDVRTDIFAVGGIAYEMITGRRAFEAQTQADLIRAILKEDTEPISKLAPGVPLPLSRALARCLSKDPDERWQTATDLLFELQSLSSLSAEGVLRSAPLRTTGWHERAAWMAMVVASLLGALYWAGSRGAGSPNTVGRLPPVRFSLSPAEGTFLSGFDVPLALSPDGQQIAYVGAAADGTKKLWVRSLYSEQQNALPGTEGASTPFWSPDSQWVGFFAANTLKKVRASSGLTQIIATDVTSFGGAAWNAEDVIIFPGFRGGLSHVSATGGPIARLTTPDEGIHFSPQFLRDSKHFIYAAGPRGIIRVGTLGGEPPRTLMTFPVRISTLGYAPGYVFFVQDSTLFAMRFDEQRLEVSGKPISIVDGIPVTTPARAAFSVSRAGVLAYWPHTLGTPARLRWLDRDGRESTAVEAPAQYRGFALSPNGRQLVFSRISRTGAADLWVRDFARNSEAQLTFDGASFTPQWSPDATRIAFSGYSQGPPPKLFVRNVSGAGAASLVSESRTNFASSWSADGRSVVSVRTQDPVNRHDLWIQRVQDGAAERLWFNTSLNESHGTVSPDGRWIAYTTDESGKDEVWVASFPAGASRRQVSTRGGTLPQWGADGKEIVFVSTDKQLIVAPLYSTNSGLPEVGPEKTLFRVATLIELDPLVWPTSNAYTATANGRRFLVAMSAQDPHAPPIRVIVNWPTLLVGRE